MSTKLFVGGLPFSLSEDELRDAFSSIGNLISVTIITDRQTGRSKGFGFVEFSTEDEAQEAINSINGKEIGGRPVTVSIARPMEKRQPRRDFGGRN